MTKINGFDVRKKFNKAYNTFYMFESILYGEFFNKIVEDDDLETVNLNSLVSRNEKIDLKFINEIFDEIWLFTNNIDINPKLAENTLIEILDSTDNGHEHFKLMKEFQVFDIDYNLLESVKDYCFNIIIEHGKVMAMKHLFYNYLTFMKNPVLDSYRIKLLVSDDNLCFN